MPDPNALSKMQQPPSSFFFWGGDIMKKSFRVRQKIWRLSNAARLRTGDSEATAKQVLPAILRFYDSLAQIAFQAGTLPTRIFFCSQRKPGV